MEAALIAITAEALELPAKKLLERPITQAFGVLGGMVGDDVRDKGACESFGALVRVL